MVTIALAGALVVGVVVATGGGGRSHKPIRQLARPAPTSTTETTRARSKPQPPPPTVAQEIMARHANADGQLDVEGALELFAYAFAPLPDVTLPTGGADQGAAWTDTALAAILRHWPELTGAQRQVVASFLNTSAPPPGSSDTTVTPPTAAAAAARPRVARLTAFMAKVDPTAAQAQVNVRVQQALLDEAGRLKHTLNDVGASSAKVHVVLSNVEDSSDGLKAGAWTWGTSGDVVLDPTSGDPPGAISGKPTDCYIYFPPSFWQNLTWTPGGPQLQAIYHEVFHCYQFFVLGKTDLKAAYGAPDWLVEGSAEWAGDSMSGYDDLTWASTLSDGTKYGYLNNPRTRLADLSHAAFGLYYEVEYLGRPLWPAWWDIWTAASAGGWTTSQWFDAVAGDHKAALTDAWGASFFVNAGLGHDWTIEASNQTTTFQNIASIFTGSLGVTAEPFSTYQVTIPEPSAGELVVAATSTGTPRYVDAAGHDGARQDAVAFCWADCNAATCTGGSSVAHPPVVTVTGTVEWALTALVDGGQANLEAINPTQFCQKDWTPVPPPCRANCAGSNGDPHIATVDGHRYEFQAAGEFVLLRSPDGSVEIQGRQEPFGPVGTARDFSINTAVAARVGSHRVGVYASSGPLSVKVDGKTVSSTSPIDLGGGGRVIIDGGGVEVDFPGGTSLWALSVRQYGINIQIAPGAALQSSGTGVLGTVPLGLRRPRLPDGSGEPFALVTAAQDYNFEYHTFADAWRVTDQDTLFDYAPGQTTSSFLAPDYVPERGPVAPSPLAPARRVSGESACDAVTRVELYDDCVYDVTATGSQGFVAGYQSVEAFQDKGVSALGPSGPTPKVGGPAPAGVTEVLPDVGATGGSVLGPDGIIYATATESAKLEILGIDPATAKIRVRTTVDAARFFNGVVSAAGSVWVITGAANGKCTIDRFDPSTLQTQATIPLDACPTATPAIAAVGDTVWTDALGPTDGQGKLLRFDPATNTLAGTVAVSTGQAIAAGDQKLAGTFASSGTALFWSDDATAYRVDPPWTSVVNLKTPAGRGHPAGDSIWFDVIGMANEYGGSGGQLASVDTNGGLLVGADDQNIYVALPGPHRDDGLFRIPVNGGSPVQIADVPSGVGNAPWKISDPRTPLFITPNAVMSLDINSPPSGQSAGDQTNALYLDAVPRIGS